MEHNEELEAVMRLLDAAAKWAKWDARWQELMQHETCDSVVYERIKMKREKWCARALSYGYHLLSSADISDRLRLVARVEVVDDADTEAPQPAPKLCGVATQAGEDRKFRTCELPAGHDGMHRTTLCGHEWVWPQTSPQPAQGEECQHGHLARVCVTCELIAAEARIAELEAAGDDLFVCATVFAAGEAHAAGREYLIPQHAEVLLRWERLHLGARRTLAEAGMLEPTDSLSAPGKEAPDAE